jgi:hypothetical protein
VTSLGAVLTTVSAVLFLGFLFLDLFGFHTNPYLGIVTFVLLPVLFLVGLLLIPAGLWRSRRRTASGRSVWPILDFTRPRVRFGAIVVLLLTAVNVAIFGAAAVGTVEYADSTTFCANVCHAPMRPEAVAHPQSVHGSISCASCHVGPGPAGFVEAKMGGVRRLAAVVTNDYARPVPVPVRDLPDAVGTCATCHSSRHYVGDRTRLLKSYGDDESSTEQVTTLVMRVGGGGDEAGGPHGIHWHASPDTRIEYVATDATRETIAWLRVTDRRGVREYTSEGVSAEQIAVGERRVMDCTDCHNRVGHEAGSNAQRAVDRAISVGLLPRLPYIRREALAAASAEYGDEAAALNAIAQRLQAFYAPPAGANADQVQQAVRATQHLYSSNVFPHMNVKWGTYPTLMGHTEATGCFRCHDERQSSAGTTVSQDCELCHRMP